MDVKILYEICLKNYFDFEQGAIIKFRDKVMLETLTQAIST